MKKSVFVIAVGSLVLAGCPSKDAAPTPVRPAEGQLAPTRTGQASPAETLATKPSPATAFDPIIATVGGRNLTMRQLTAPLIESYGLNALLNLANLEIAKFEAEKRGVLVSESDVDQEREAAIDRLIRNSDAFDRIKTRIELADEKKDTVRAAQLREELKQDRTRLLIQHLEREKIGRGEFEIVLQTSTYLRKIAEPAMKDKITDEALQEKFKTEYGEKVRVRHMVLSNMQEVAEAQKRLAGGAAFETVAREMSRNARSRALGGELPPFSRATPDLSQAFKEATFLLKTGQVSDPVQADGGYHLIKLEERILPRVIKFDDVKESLRADLSEDWVNQTVRLLTQDLSQQVVNTLKIENPSLKAQFEARMDQRDKQIRDREQMKREMDKQREKMQQDQSLTTQPTASQSTTTQVTATQSTGSRPSASPSTTSQAGTPTASGPDDVQASVPGSTAAQPSTNQPATNPSTMPAMQSEAPATSPASPAARTPEVVRAQATQPAAPAAGTPSTTTRSTP